MTSMTRKLLVVDHVATRRTSLKLLLTQEHYKVFEAASCEAALSMLQRRRIDVVLSETELPGRSGLYLLKELKKRRPDIEVILLSHNASSYNTLQALRCGAHDFIVRPIDSGEFLFQALERAYAAIQKRHEEQQLIIELESRNRQMGTTLGKMTELQRACETLAAIENPGELLEALLDEALALCRADRGLLALNGRNGQLALKIGRGLADTVFRNCAERLPDGLLSAIYEHGRPILVGDRLPLRLQERTNQLEREGMFHTPGILALPVRRGGGAIGLLALMGHSRQEPFSEADLQRLTQLTNQAALHLDKTARIHRLNRQLNSRPHA